MALKRALFVPKSQTLVSSQDVSQLSFTTLTGQNLSIITPSKILFREDSKFFCFQLQSLDKLEPMELELYSPISLWQKQKIVFSNQRSLTNKTQETFDNQSSIDYLSSTNNIVEYKIDCQYFYTRFFLIAHDFSIDKLKNIFNATLLQFLKNNKKYN